ncbi:MAG: hypothetical protein R3C05_30820 [Pirellulaceae bacterium]
MLERTPRVARNLAMIHGAMFDAINSFDGGYESYAATEALLREQTESLPLPAHIKLLPHSTRSVTS